MIQFNSCIYLRRYAFLLFFVTGLIASMGLARSCLAAALNQSKQFPLIIMGGHWSSHAKPGGYSDLSRVCNAGFTHVFSYFTEAMLNSKITLDGQIASAVEFSSTVKNNCPGMGLVIGIPRRWIYEGRLDLIAAYISGLKEKNIAVDYWFSDEIIHEMVNVKGLTLEESQRRAMEAIDAVKKVSNVPYIWNEPGNYNPRLGLILDVLSDLPVEIKAYDEYVISRTGRLSNPKSQLGFYSLLATLKRLKSKGNLVYPISEIGNHNNSNIAPTDGELAAISISLLMNGADGLIFWEERWATSDLLGRFKEISSVINYLNAIGINNFVQTNEIATSWESKSGRRITKIVLNTTEKDIEAVKLLPKGSIILWPSTGLVHELKPMDLLVYYYE